MKIKLGSGFDANLLSIIDTKLLIQANSGGGKSYVLRKLLEESHGKVHQIVLDIEGEFASLREKYDYVLAGKGGDIPAMPESAEILAHKILELQADLIVDLYELKQHERIRFVKNFLNAMINAPKELWHQTLVVLDEAHIFAPEKGSAESLSAVIDMATRGRKRGFGLVPATQRLSKLHKDVAAECNNKMIGRTMLDIDLRRAGDELGWTDKERFKLRTLHPGEFIVFGPAFGDGSVKTVNIGEVKTRHPEAGRRGKYRKPAPTRQVKSVLLKLKDLPQEAAEELTDRKELQAKVKELERELRKKPKTQEMLSAPKITNKELLRDAKNSMWPKFQKIAIEAHNKINEIMADFRHDIKKLEPEKYVVPVPETIYNFEARGGGSSAPIHKGKIKLVPGEKVNIVIGNSFGPCERKILGFLASQPHRSFTKTQVAAMSGYAQNSGSFSNSLSKLTSNSFIHRPSKMIQITQHGSDWVRENGADLPVKLQDWINKLGKCERAIYENLLQSPGETFQKQDVALNTGYEAGSGSFSNALSRLNTLGLITKDSGGIRINEELINL